ncbi:MAG: hypothetical protein J6V37_01560 [Clostridia bacterium]|nr:hypothetical protein [Clostridia bacterium]
MASTNTITEIIAAIKTIYPYYAKDADVKTLVKTWGALLQGFDDNDVMTALYMSLQTCKMPPTPADLIERLNDMRDSLEPSDEELWNEFSVALRKARRYIYAFNFTYVEANGKTQGQNARIAFSELWNNMPEKLRMYLGGEGEFLRLAQSGDDEELKFERNRFMKTMPTIRKRHEVAKMQLAISAGNEGGSVLRIGGRN